MSGLCIQSPAAAVLMTHGGIPIKENSRAIHTSFPPITSKVFPKNYLTRYHAKLYLSTGAIWNFISSCSSAAFRQTISCPLPVFTLAFDTRYPGLSGRDIPSSGD